MGSIAKGHLARVFAGAPRYGFGFGNFNLPRLDAGSLVRSITERLAFRTAASAPPINSRLNFLDDGRSLKDNRFSHA
jgi:hypothetical protein